MKVKQQKPASTNKRRNTDGSHVFLAGLSHDEDDDDDDDDDDDEEGETKRVRVQRICLGCGTAEKASETFCS
ncbi:uncharacterized protein PADG_07232 [Paracoccidioides brasiliensis Pb18]|uniref:Uncharacterized protein n=1 Tax=Paracoccidioides brasiliensis (strain Pb18) TaxID=502780 RepID=C1GIZ6_PARBD|nr:uncharacterized protein PADG_07232 [Paracoccidioides brasiliensis Pb18]EEH42412.2 hypothetical protein PADG_07232 [Paracoccidioides brasiliensis Pb18]